MIFIEWFDIYSILIKNNEIIVLLRGDREISQYIPGDFLIHFAGKKGRKRVLLMEHYLSLSEKNYIL